MSKEEVNLKIINQLIKQINDESPQSFLWMISIIQRLHLHEPGMTMIDFLELIQVDYPEKVMDIQLYHLQHKGMVIFKEDLKN